MNTSLCSRNNQSPELTADNFHAHPPLLGTSSLDGTLQAVVGFILVMLLNFKC